MRTALAIVVVGVAAAAAVSVSARQGGPPAWNARAAASYLDGELEWWSTWPNAARDHGTFCVSCHTVGTLDGLGGGKLGPDLTLVYERLGGRKAVGAWLSAPATPTMQALFRNAALQPEEILPLLSVFEDAARRSPYGAAGSGPQLNFFLAGFIGACIALGIMGWVWRSRFRNVRRSLVNESRGGE